MTLRTFTPMDLAQTPSIGNFQDVPYNWDRQSRVTESHTIYCGNKQTFNHSGQPYDSTNGTGNTGQTFGSDGKPKDNKSD